MNLKQWNSEQVKEAGSSDNRYFFWVIHQRDPIDFDELLLFYINNGGAKGFAQRHKGERDEQQTSSPS